VRQGRRRRALSAEIHGHFTRLRAALWKQYLIDFLKELPPREI
jgi:hypothetical protein